MQSLFAQTLVGDGDNEEAWEAVSGLRAAGNREIFEFAAAWCLNDDPMKRARGAAVLGQLTLVQP